MKCPKCDNQNLVLEGLGDGKKKLVCQSCGYSTIVDDEGRHLLTGERGLPKDGRQLLES